MGYGIYTVGDDNFFAGIVASINALRFFGCQSPVAVIDIGFAPWMREYLCGFRNVEVLPVPLRGILRYTDVRSDEDPIMRGWAYKAFSIVHYDLFEQFTFIDGDFLPLCNLESEVRPLLDRGDFVCTEDGTNQWDSRHEEAIGVPPGNYVNINAGFISADTREHAFILHEWRNLMTRSKPFDLWYGDQGALNAILDKYQVRRHFLDHSLWNQTWKNAEMAEENQVFRHGDLLIHRPTGERIYSWHGCGWHKLWHQIGIDHYRRDTDAREAFHLESLGKSPQAVVEYFADLLFLDRFQRPLRRNGHLLE